MFRNRILASTLAAGLACLALAAGCDSGPELAPVTGVVTHRGQPLAGANVMFAPENGIPAGATTGEDGRFELVANDGRKGAIPGTHRVSIVKPSPEPPPPLGGSATPPPPPAPPLEHHTVVEVQAGDANEFTFDIAQ